MRITAITLTAMSLLLSACGTSDEAAEDASADIVEMPAEEAMPADAWATPAADAAATPAADADAAAAATEAEAAAAAAAAAEDAEKKSTARPSAGSGGPKF